MQKRGSDRPEPVPSKLPVMRRHSEEESDPDMLLLLGEEASLGGKGGAIDSLNPATGESIGRVPCSTVEDVGQAVDSAVAAHTLWRGSSFDERSGRLRALAERVREQAEEIAGLIALEQGKPFLEALSMEVLPALDHLAFVAAHAEALTSSEAINPRQPLYAHKRAHFLYDSIGVVAVVTPSNLPFSLPLIQVGAALAMGNAVVFKPSDLTPLCGLKVGELVLEAGFTPGLVSVIHGGRENALHLVANPKVDKVFFTGSLESGQDVMAAAGCTPKPVVLSLGGKHASIVASDADLARAARGIVWGALANCGQNCGAVERVYVEQPIAARFLERVIQEVDRLTMGDPLSDGVDIGPLVSEARRDDVHSQVSEAVEDGGRLVRGGGVPAGPGFFYPPTILLAPPADSRLIRAETLGPVIPITVVDSLEHAIFLANDSDYALTASGWTGSAVTAERLMVGLQAGVVTINDVLYSFGEPASTWSGYRSSGLGQKHGRAGLREMCRVKFASFDPLPSQGPVFGFPYDGTAARIARKAIGALHRRRRAGRLRNLIGLTRIKRFRSRVRLRSFLLGFWQRQR